jgi:hypothetical protein
VIGAGEDAFKKLAQDEFNALLAQAARHGYALTPIR